MRFEVKDGGFGYPRGGCIFSHVNFTMDKPEVLSVLGANGAGKTTLLKCMLGLLEWKTGGTYIDGINIKEIPYHQLWQQIGYVPQAKASASCGGYGPSGTERASGHLWPAKKGGPGNRPGLYGGDWNRIS